MSGIGGVYSPEGGLSEQGLLALADRLGDRAADGLDQWNDSHCGLVHAHFWTTPEEAGERQPLVSSDGRHVLSADARIDNRDELISLLSDALAKPQPSDGELVLAAYQRWGRDCFHRLIGDFAIALWDEPFQTLILARDPIGLRQLYYGIFGSRLVFGSNIRSVLALAPQPPGLNEQLIHDFLNNYFDLWVTQTIYRGLLRIPPAHFLEISPEGQRLVQFFQFSATGPVVRTDSEWIEGFRACLDEAVRCRLRSLSPVAIFTGGGLDSSAISGVAHDLVPESDVQLHASVFNRTPSADENRFFDLLSSHCHRFRSVRIPSDDYWAFRESGTDNGFPLDEPEPGLMRSHTLALFRSAARRGCRVSLIGEGSNQMLAYGVYRVAQLAATLGLRELGEIFHFRRASRAGWPRLAYHLAQPWLPAPLTRALRRFRDARAYRPGWVLSGNGLSPSPGDCGLPRSYFSPGELSPVALYGHEQVRRKYDFARYSYLDNLAGYSRVECRAPFLDRRLIEYLLRVPRHLWARHGVDRLILRESMCGRLPEEVRMRPDKSYLTDLFPRGIRDKERAKVERLLAAPRAADLGFLDAAALRESFQEYWSGASNSLVFRQRPLALEEWFQASIRHKF